MQNFQMEEIHLKAVNKITKNFPIQEICHNFESGKTLRFRAVFKSRTLRPLIVSLFRPLPENNSGEKPFGF